MKLTIFQETLAPLLADLLKCIPSRPQLPTLSCIYFEAKETQQLVLAATDLQFGMRITIEAKVSEPGKVAIPAKGFSELINSLSPGKVELSHSENTLKVSADGANAQMQTFKAEDYPVFPEKDGEALPLPLKLFGPAVQLTSFAASSDEARPLLTALRISTDEQLEMVATDGFRLARIILPYEGDARTILLPSKAVSEAIRIASKKEQENVVFTVSEQLKQAFVSFGNYEVVMRLLDGEYPPYQKILSNSYNTQVSFDTQEFLQKMKLASIFSRDSAGIVTLILAEDKLTIRSSSSSLGSQESTVNIQHISGEPVEISFNSRYLQDFFSTVKPERVWLGVNESLKPAAFRPEGMAEYTYIVMPFRVNQ